MTIQIRPTIFQRAFAAKKKILVVWGVLLIVATLGLAAYYAYRSYSQLPLFSYEVTNITPTSFTVVWRTETKTRAWIKIDDSSQMYYDTRDMMMSDSGDYELDRVHSFYTHHVTVTDLEPGTEYPITIYHNYVRDEVFTSASVTTPAESGDITTPEPIYGEVDSGTVDLDDSILLVRIEEKDFLDADSERSTWASVSLDVPTYTVDVANVYSTELDGSFVSLLENKELYTLRIKVITPGGSVEHIVGNDMYQPIDTIIVEEEDLNPDSAIKQFFSKLVTPAYASCPSECVGDCQGCNLESPTNPLCITYGCGYMSWCCGYGSAECENHCTNGKQDCDETGVDCGGGGCKTCSFSTSSAQCSGDTPCMRYDGGGCVARNPVTGNCNCAVNGDIDSDAGETGRNCGGPYCPACTNAGSHCFDRVWNKDTEEGLDCGGDCAASCAVAGLAMFIDAKCTNEGEVFTCKDRPDWNCWCRGGYVLPYHTKSTEVRATTATSRISQEFKTWFYANSKFGIHTGIGAGSPYGTLLDDGSVGYVMNVVSSMGQYKALLEEYRNLPEGVVPIVRFCYDGNEDSCELSDLNNAAEFMNQMAAELGRPIAVISGPNEPLQEPWTLPGGCSGGVCDSDEDVQRVADATARWMNEFLGLTGGASNLIHLSPDLNTSESNFEKFVQYMKDSGADFGALDGVAANAYEGAGGKTIADVVEELKKLGIPVFITEAGVDPSLQASDPENFQRLMNALGPLVEDPAVMAALLFNPLVGFNPDYPQHNLTTEQYQAVASAFAGTEVQTTPSASDATPPGYVVGSSSGATCTRSTKTVSGGQTCCKGECLEVCYWNEGGVEKSATHFIEKAGCPGVAGDLFMDWEGVTDHVEPAVYPGQWFTIDNTSFMCIQIFTWGSAPESGYPEHGEGICVYGGGADVGVSGGQGSYPSEGFSLVSRAYAQDSDEAVEPGVYQVTGSNVEVTTQKIEITEPGLLRFFYDTNGDGVKDESEVYLTDSEAATIEVTLDKDVDVMSYDITPGWNSFTLPLVMQGDETSQIETASHLLAYFRTAGVNATHIAAYRGQQFLIYSERSDGHGGLLAFGTNFGVIPGEGYFLNAGTGGKVSFAGNLPTDAMPITLSSGWNLVGFYNPSQEMFTAFDLLDDIQSDKIPADILTKRENGRYTGVVVKDGENYGSDFNVYREEAYWVRVGTDGGFTEKTYTP